MIHHVGSIVPHLRATAWVCACQHIAVMPCIQQNAWRATDCTCILIRHQANIRPSRQSPSIATARKDIDAQAKCSI